MHIFDGVRNRDMFSDVFVQYSRRLREGNRVWRIDYSTSKEQSAWYTKTRSLVVGMISLRYSRSNWYCCDWQVLCVVRPAAVHVCFRRREMAELSSPPLSRHDQQRMTTFRNLTQVGRDITKSSERSCRLKTIGAPLSPCAEALHKVMAVNAYRSQVCREKRNKVSDCVSI